MTETPKPRGVIHEVLARCADLWAQYDRVPEDRLSAYRQQFIRVMELGICEVIGTDTVPLSGWAITPSARQDRRARILDALQMGDDPAVIAARELVSVRTVQRMRHQ